MNSQNSQWSKLKVNGLLNFAGWCLLDLAPLKHMMEERSRAKLRRQRSHPMVLL